METTGSFTWIVMTKEDEKFDPKKEIWVTILDPESDQYPGDYSIAAVITNVAPKEAAFVL
jgi:hypothetical protein